MTKTQKTDNNKYWKVCEKNWSTYSFLWKNKMLRHFIKVCQFIKQLNIVNIKQLPCDTENPLLDTYPREMKTYIPIKMYTWMFIAALFTIAKKWKQPKCPSTGELINRMWCIKKMEFYLVIKKNDHWYCYKIDEPWEHYAKWRKPVTKDHKLLCDFFMWNFQIESFLKGQKVY